MKYGWLIYNKKDLDKNRAFAEKLIEDSKEEQIELLLFIKEDLTLGIEENRLSVRVKNKKVSYPDFIINRTRDAFLGQQFESLGISVFNSSKVAAICNDKWATHQYISTLGIPMMDSFLFHKAYMRIDKCHFQYPIVIKSLDGHGGNEVFKAESLEQAEKVLQDLSKDHLLIQPLCTKPGVDIRVFIVGNKIVQAMKRISQNDFRSNYSLGGRVETYTLTKEEKNKVQKILNHLPMDFAGIDFILDDQDNFLFNEIEDVVGCRMLYAMTEIDASKLYVTYIRKALEKSIKKLSKIEIG